MIHTLFAMLLFTFFAITGLIVDVGFARLTQRQMSQATEAASLEGVRLTDTVGTGFDDQARRAAVGAMLKDHYDDDFGVTAADQRNYGAGPAVALGPGQGSIGANRQVLVDRTNPVFKPTPQLNPTNARHGDLVDGVFDTDDPAHLEDTAYARTDFDASWAPTSNDTRLDAFLVRLRRTYGDNALDEQTGTSSRGPTLPYLFAQGSMIAPEMRERGITVRATAIAGARRATTVGMPNAAAGLPGASPFLLEYGFWMSLEVGETLRLRFKGDGALVGPEGNRDSPRGGPPQPNPYFPYEDRGGPPIIPPGQINPGSVPIGMLSFRGHSAYPISDGRRSWSIGDDAYPIALSWSQVMEWLGYPNQPGYVSGAVHFYVPIYEGVVTWDGRPGRQPGEAFKVGDPRVVGFGAVIVVRADSDGFDGDGDGDDDDLPELEVVKLPSYVAPFNASAVETPGLAGALASTIMARYRTLDEPLRAAALVR